MKRLVRASRYVQAGTFDKTFLAVAIGKYRNVVAVIEARDEDTARKMFVMSTSVSTTWDSIYINRFKEAQYRNYLNEVTSQSDQRRHTVDVTEEVAKLAGVSVPPQYEEGNQQAERVKAWDRVFLALTKAGGPLYVTYVEYDADRRISYWGRGVCVWPIGRYILEGTIEESEYEPSQEIEPIRVEWDITGTPPSVEDGMSMIMNLLQDELAARGLPSISYN